MDKAGRYTSLDKVMKQYITFIVHYARCGSVTHMVMQAKISPEVKR